MHFRVDAVRRGYRRSAQGCGNIAPAGRRSSRERGQLVRHRTHLGRSGVLRVGWQRGLVAVRPLLAEQQSARAAGSWRPVSLAVSTVTTVAAVAD